MRIRRARGVFWYPSWSKNRKKNFFEKSLEKNFWLEKIFFRGYNFNKWAAPYTPLYYESLTQKGSKGHSDREPPYSWFMSHRFWVTICMTHRLWVNSRTVYFPRFRPVCHSQKVVWIFCPQMTLAHFPNKFFFKKS